MFHLDYKTSVALTFQLVFQTVFLIVAYIFQQIFGFDWGLFPVGLVVILMIWNLAQLQATSHHRLLMFINLVFIALVFYSIRYSLVDFVFFTSANINTVFVGLVTIFVATASVVALVLLLDLLTLAVLRFTGIPYHYPPNFGL